MDRTEGAPAPPPAKAAALAPRGSQSKLSATLLFVLLAAILFRVVTAVTDRSGRTAEHGVPPLVRWVALEKAGSASASQGRPVLYDFSAEWCLPCHRLDDEGWGDEGIARLVNGSYVPVRVIDRQREEGKNPLLVEELQKKYAVEAFPTLIIAADGKEVARMDGYGGRSALKKFLEDAKRKVDGEAAVPRR